jgi:hypothetical protein
VNKRLEELLTLRGQALLEALVKELVEIDHRTSELAREIAALRDFQTGKQRLLIGKTNVKAELPRSVEIEATHLLPTHHGFYPIEYHAGTGFRWTGPLPAFSFDVFVNRRHGADLELRALGCVDSNRQRATIRLAADGENVPVDIAADGKGLVISAKLPARDEDCSSRIVFSIETLQPPGSADPRMLGLSFVKLRLSATQVGDKPVAELAESHSPRLRVITAATPTQGAE